MDKSELHAIAKLMGYRVVAVQSSINKNHWSAHVTHNGKRVMHIVRTINPTKRSALNYGWDWIRHNVDIFKGGNYEED